MEIIRADIGREFFVSFASGATSMPAMHHHSAYEIYILEKGSRTYLINDALTELHAHDVVLIRPNVIHCTAGGSYTRHLINFEQSYLEKFFTPAAQEKLLTCFDQPKLHISGSDFEHLLRLIHELEHNHEDFTALAQLLTFLCQNARTDTSFVSSKNKMLSDIIEYIGKHYESISGLEEIADRFYISKYYLCRLFRAHTGTSVMKYIHLLRIQTACEWLKTSSKSVEEIALLCGFHTTMYFCRIFKGIVGKTPSQYRRTNEQSSHTK